MLLSRDIALYIDKERLWLLLCVRNKGVLTPRGKNAFLRM